MSTLWQHLRFTIRLAAKNPGFTILAVLMLGIGIGINSAIFSFVDCVILHPFPIKDSERIATISAQAQGQFAGFSYSDCLDIQRQSLIFTDLAASSGHPAELALKGSVEFVMAENVSSRYFSVLGIKPDIGRFFAEDERANPGEPINVVISHGLWQRQFGADPAIVGKNILVYRHNAVIRGVSPASFPGLRAPRMTELWIQMDSTMLLSDPAERESKAFEQLIGRMRPDATIEQARAELGAIGESLSKNYPASNKGITYAASPLNRPFGEAARYIGLLLGGPILVLLICCANYSGMMLAQIEARPNEFAVKLALGVGGRALLRQILTESSLFVGMATFVGIIIASWLIALLPPALMSAGPLRMRMSIEMNLHVILFTIAIAFSVALISCLKPALQAGKSDLIASLKDKFGVAGKGGSKFRFRSFLVAGQIALSLILLVSTGLLMKSLLNAERINPGFDAKRNLLIVHVACISNPANSYNEFFLPAIDSLLSIPGVKRASFAKQMLLSGSGDGASCEVDIPGATLPKGQKNFSIRCNSVGRNYFETVGSLIFRGRAFDNNDELPDHRTIIVNETMAERFWPNADPIGKNVSIRGKDYQIVGIAQANRIQSIHEEPEPYLYIPFSQEPGNDGEVLIETMNDPMSIAGAARNKILSVDKSAFIQNPITLKSIMRQALYEERLLAFLALSLGILGALLSAVGLYAVVARLAEKRTREIGIRVALGAMNKDISRLVIREGYRISLVGIGIGLVASFFIARLLRDALYGVAPADPISYIVGSAVVLTISLAASYVPARKAIKADPMIALRNE